MSDPSVRDNLIVSHGASPQPLGSSRPLQREGTTYHFTITSTSGNSFDGYLVVNQWDGQVREVFISTAKAGSFVHGMVDSLAVLMSNALQHGMPLFELCKALMGLTYEPKGATSDPDVPTCLSLADYLGQRLATYLSNEERRKLNLPALPLRAAATY